MLCEKCGVKNATTHIRTVINGQLREKHLCSFCAADQGYNTINEKNITQMLSSIFSDNMSTTKHSKVIRCECCGSSFNDIVNSGKCGCAQCYRTFYEKLLPYFKRAQYGEINHKGKKLNKTTDILKSNAQKIDELRTTLNQLVKEEKYEDAAVIRDQIKLLEGE